MYNEKHYTPPYIHPPLYPSPPKAYFKKKLKKKVCVFFFCVFDIFYFFY